MKQTLKLFWGCIPLGIFVFCVVIVVFIEKTTSCTLRSIPREVLMGIGGGSTGVFLLWGNIRYTFFKKSSDKYVYRIIAMSMRVFSIAIFSILVFAILFLAGFAHRPEHIITKNNIKMVASVNCFLDEIVYYYQYKNPFFYGKELGYEYYGSGGGDPLAQSPQPEPVQWYFYDLDGTLIENGFIDSDSDSFSGQDRADTSLEDAPHEIKSLNLTAVSIGENRFAFPILIDDFISNYNGRYYKDAGKNFLQESSQWTKFRHASTVYSKHEAYCYRFQKDASRLSEPTISIYVSKKQGYIEEITLDFDDHGYTGWTYELYQQEGFYTLNVLLPRHSDDEIKKIFDQLLSLAYKDRCFFSKKEAVEPSVLYYEENVGIYPYYSAGMVHVCVMPVTKDKVEDFIQEGIEVYEISQLCH